MNPENVTASTFIELRDGKTYEGVIFRISESMVLLPCREDGDTFMIPVTGGLQITGFFLDLQLKELKLELFMDDPEDCQTLFKSYNVPITNLVPSNPDIKYVGHLHLQWNTLENGTYTISFWANDTDDYEGSLATLVHKDILAPVVYIPSPMAAINYVEAPTFTITVEDAQLDKTWYIIGADTTKYFFSGSTFTIDAEAWAAQPGGSVNIRIYANDTLGNERISPIIITKALSTNWDWLWFVAIGGIIGVVLMVVVLRKKKKNKM